MVKYWKAPKEVVELPALGRDDIPWYGLLGMVVFCPRLDFMSLEVFSNLNKCLNSMITTGNYILQTNKYRPLKNPIALLEA